MTKYRVKCFGLFGLLLSVIPATAQVNAGMKQQEQKSIPVRKNNERQQVLPSATDDPSYKIGAGDVLDISVWKEPGISRAVPVRPDGKISLPLLNDVEAAGLTPMELMAQLAEKLRKFVTDPQVTVVVTEINSRRIFVLGEVSRPGAFPMLPNMTVLQAISSAGGFTLFANQKKIYVLRNDDGKQGRFNFDYKQVVRGEKPEQNIILQPGDTIVVP